MLGKLATPCVKEAHNRSLASQSFTHRKRPTPFNKQVNSERSGKKDKRTPFLLEVSYLPVRAKNQVEKLAYRLFELSHRGVLLSRAHPT